MVISDAEDGRNHRTHTATTIKSPTGSSYDCLHTLVSDSDLPCTHDRFHPLDAFIYTFTKA